MKARAQLSGGHVLGVLLGFFALILAANAAFIYFAVKSYPGEKEQKSYRQGLLYNEVLTERALQAALGWSAAIEEILTEGSDAALIVSFHAANGRPLEGLVVAGSLQRPASSEGAQEFAFEPIGGGRYRAVVASPRGAWDLTVVASSAAGDRLQFTNRVVLP
ncbi:MAG: FixH family protein [Parvularculaceae bacterium]